ncbi:metallophosphatase family protein [Rhizobium sp. TRM95111]|uniref:metallophosphoesterase family protein n=1 Tax=Rhizobium alarense TaxID=2846851 RepID=UPI001F33EC5B|nr:metallophosphoesterase family protein [Rhizobium alarense]MCF3639490.1 metallophosphatase family protein [Rhizobium alarense]
MQIAVIADIHGNDLALEAVLADIDRRGIRDIVNLGDNLSGPLNAARTADLLMARGIPGVRGNHDRYLIEQAPETMGLSDRCAHDQLSDRHRTWLESLPGTRVVGDLFLCHATPTDDATYWLEALSADGRITLGRPDLIERHAEGLEHPVLLCGHSHVPRALRLGDGRLLVNPGSVGCPGYTDDEPVFHAVETGSPDARYAIIDKGGAGWTVALISVAYDHRAMARLAAERGRDEWARALATGWI